MILYTIKTCQARPILISIKSNETFFYSYTDSFNKFGGNCNSINDPYDGDCVPNKVQIYDF